MIDTGDGDDRAIGNKGGDMILGLGGKDLVRARKGKDRIGGGGGKDKLRGQGNADLLAARDGSRDLVHGGASHRDRARADRVDRVRKERPSPNVGEAGGRLRVTPPSGNQSVKYD